MTTAYGTPKVTMGALTLGVFRVMTKSFEVHDMSELVLRARASARH